MYNLIVSYGFLAFSKFTGHVKVRNSSQQSVAVLRQSDSDISLACGICKKCLRSEVSAALDLAENGEEAHITSWQCAATCCSYCDTVGPGDSIHAISNLISRPKEKTHAAYRCT